MLPSFLYLLILKLSDIYCEEISKEISTYTDLSQIHHFRRSISIIEGLVYFIKFKF
jgi:hypothetical protein